jgi:hypothetical protein
MADSYVGLYNRFTIEVNMNIAWDDPNNRLAAFGAYDGEKLILAQPTPDGVGLYNAVGEVGVVWGGFNRIKLVSQGKDRRVRLYINGAAVASLDKQYSDIAAPAAADLDALKPMMQSNTGVISPGLFFIHQWPVANHVGQRLVDIDYLYAKTEDVVQGDEAVIITRRTKVDTQDERFARKYDRRQGGVLQNVFTAVGLADDDLGGDFFLERDVPPTEVG